MLTLHITKTQRNIIIPEADFLKLIESHKIIEPIQVIEHEMDELTEDELEQLRLAEERFEMGEYIDFDDVKEKWLRGENAEI